MVFKFLISLYWYHIVTLKYNLYILYLPFLTKDRLSSRHLSLYHIHSHIWRKSVSWENNILISQSNILLCNWHKNLQKFFLFEYCIWWEVNIILFDMPNPFELFSDYWYPSSDSVSTICIWLLIFATTYLFMRLYRISSSDWFPWLTW